MKFTPRPASEMTTSVTSETWPLTRSGKFMQSNRRIITHNLASAALASSTLDRNQGRMEAFSSSSSSTSRLYVHLRVSKTKLSNNWVPHPAALIFSGSAMMVDGVGALRWAGGKWLEESNEDMGSAFMETRFRIPSRCVVSGPVWDRGSNALGHCIAPVTKSLGSVTSVGKSSNRRVSAAFRDGRSGPGVTRALCRQHTVLTVNKRGAHGI